MTVNRWVVNASPIICMARVGLEDLLLELSDELIVPHKVVDEIEAGPISDPARKALASGKLPINNFPDRPEILSWDLGLGETAVLSYVYDNPGWSQ